VPEVGDLCLDSVTGMGRKTSRHGDGLEGQLGLVFVGCDHTARSKAIRIGIVGVKVSTTETKLVNYAAKIDWPTLRQDREFKLDAHN